MKRALGCFVLLVALGGIVGADESNPGAPPRTYLLSDVTIECKRVGRWSTEQTITLSGKGEGFKAENGDSHDPRRTTFVVNPKEVFDVLQLCYRENFFSFPDTYEHPAVVDLGVAGKVQTLTKDLDDVPVRTITVRIGKYSKSVSFQQGHGKPPEVLSEIFKLAENFATRQVTQ